MGNYLLEERIRQKMEAHGIGRSDVETFLEMLKRVKEEHLSYVPLESVSTPDWGLILDTPRDPGEVESLSRVGLEFLSKAVVIKLNGGRSTTMGGMVPKGTLAAKDGRSYLDIIVEQIKAVRDKWGVEVPLILMNSFFTHEPTVEVLRGCDIPVRMFLQSKVPRLVEDTLEPLDTGTDDDWVPPGHGDVYWSLRRSGLLEELIAEGRRFAFISNLDNLAAGLDPWILGLIERDELDFLMEVTYRTLIDRKGGAIVVRDGKLDLLEIAQVAAQDRPLFMDIQRFPVFNTNNVWVDLKALATALHYRGFALPIIQNRKKVAGKMVIQLETAMGAAIGSFPRARGLRVGRDRFFPTKKVEDLFVLQSDACVLDSMYRLKKSPQRPDSLPLRPRVAFGTDFLDSALNLGSRFEDPSSVSMVNAESLEVRGPVYFEKDVKIEGRVIVQAPPGEVYRIRQGSVLRDGQYP